MKKDNKEWSSRSEARENLMQFLYSFDMQNLENLDNLEEWFKINDTKLNKSQKKYFVENVNSVLENLEEIDNMIIKYLKNWEFSRLPKVDRAILRLATNEIIFNPSIPVGVSINEAVELSKKYSTENSYRFLNGVLGSIAKERE